MQADRLHTSFVIVDAKASAKPASEALMAGEATAIKPVTPIMPLEIRLKRTESHRLTEEGFVKLFFHRSKKSSPPHIQ
jgi:hypothetical protein